MRFKTMPIFLAFSLMGLADAMGPMSDGVKKQYELSNVVATLLPFFVFIAFAVFSIPGGLLASRIGKKKLLLLGLGLNAVALLIPSLQSPSFALLLGVLGAGALMTGLQFLAIPGVVVAGMGFANILPMLFSITIEDKPECANELGGLMCMALSGGALLPLLMGWLLDLGWSEMAFPVPAACFAYLLLLSVKGGHKPADSAFARERAA
jgi:fucose permease